MRKLFFLALPLVGFVGAVRGAYYFDWKIDGSTTPFAFASMLNASSGEPYFAADSDTGSRAEGSDLVWAEGVTIDGDDNVTGSGVSTLKTTAYLDPYNANESFYFEIYDDQGNPVGRTGSYLFSDYKPYTLESLKANGSRSDGLGMITIGADSFGGAAPEPTGGMLILLGLAALGLKRRK